MRSEGRGTGASALNNGPREQDSSLARKARLALVILMLAISTTSSAFIGNFTIGGHKVPCAVACGSKGIVNLGFTSDLADAYIFGSSVDRMSSNLHAIGDEFIKSATAKLNAVLDDKLAALDALATKQRKAFIDELNLSASSALREVDEVLQKNIATLDSNLDTQQGNFFGTLLRWLISLGQIALFIGGIFCVIAAILRFNTKKQAPQRWIAVAAIIGIVGVAAYLLPIALRKSHEADYRSEYAQAGFQNALVDAKALWKTWPKMEKYRLWQDRARLVRDFIELPRVVTRNDSLKELDERLNNVANDIRATFGVRDADLDVLRAIVYWRKSDSRLGEYFSALYAYNAIKAAERPTDQLPFALSELPRYYIQAYLLRPLSDEQLRQAGLDRAAANAASADGTLFPSIEELRAVAGDTPNGDFELAYQALHLATIPKYVKLVSLHASQVTAGKVERESIRQQEIVHADQILKAWDDFSNTHMVDVSERKQAIVSSGMTAIFARALSYKRALGAIDHSFDLGEIEVGTLTRTDLPLQPYAVKASKDLSREPCVANLFHLGVLKNIPPRLNPTPSVVLKLFGNTESTVGRVIRADGISRQRQQEDHLYQFEYFLYQAHVVPGTSFDSCQSKKKFDELLAPPLLTSPPSVTPPSVSAAPELVLYMPFELRRDVVIPAIEADDVELFKDLKMPWGDIFGSANHSIGEASLLGLFVCSNVLAEFDNCKAGQPIVSFSQLLFDTSPFRNALTTGMQSVAMRSAHVRALPVID